MGQLDTRTDTVKPGAERKAAPATRRQGPSGGASTSAQLLALQHPAGNRVVARLVAGSAPSGGERSIEDGAESLAPAVESALAGGVTPAGAVPPPLPPSSRSGRGGFEVPDDVGRDTDSH